MLSILWCEDPEKKIPTEVFLFTGDVLALSFIPEMSIDLEPAPVSLEEVKSSLGI